jgi:hypothetical protein
MANGNGMPHAALRLIWGHYYNVAQVFYSLYQVAYAGGGYPIIVGNQYGRQLCFALHMGKSTSKPPGRCEFYVAFDLGLPKIFLAYPK